MPNLLDLSGELLAHICGLALIFSYPFPPPPPLAHPDGVISNRLSKSLRDLLRPFRSCRRLYRIAKHEFLESNVIALNLSDLRMSACRLEYQPDNSQLPYTGNPDPLLAQLVHVELAVSISDMRAPFSQPFANRNESGVLWKSQEDVLSLRKEAANLNEMTRLCRSLRTLHVFLKIDEWFLYGRGPNLTKGTDGEMTDAGARYRRHAEALVEMVGNANVKVATVSFRHWTGSAEVLDLREMEPSGVIEKLLGSGILVPVQGGGIWQGKIARLRTAGVKVSKTEQPQVKLSWGASDDLQ